MFVKLNKNNKRRAPVTEAGLTVHFLLGNERLHKVLAVSEGENVLFATSCLS